jgi:hypothetical protein
MARVLRRLAIVAASMIATVVTDAPIAARDDAQASNKHENESVYERMW